MRIDGNASYVGQSSAGGLSGALRSGLNRVVWRLIGLGLIALAMTVWLSLLTWTAAGPESAALPPQGLIAKSGNFIATLLLHGFGLATLLLALPVMMWGCQLAERGSVSAWRGKLAGFALLMLSLTAALSLLPTPGNWPVDRGIGGSLGDGLAAILFKLFSTAPGAFKAVIASAALMVASAVLLGRQTGITLKQLTSVAARPQKQDPIYMNEQPAPRRASSFSSGFLSGLFGRKSDRYVYEDDLEPLTEVSSIAARFAPEDPEPIDSNLDVVPDRTASDRDGRIEPTFIDPELEQGQRIAARFAPRNSQTAGVETPQQAGQQTAVQQSMSFEPEAQGLDPASNQPSSKADQTPVRGKQKPAKSGLLNTVRQQQSGYRGPSLRLLQQVEVSRSGNDLTQSVLRGNARLLEDVLADFGVKGEIVGVHPGPVVTLYELEPARGVKSSRIIGLADDIARSMSAISARVAVIPGRNAIGIELPNMKREPVGLRQLLSADVFRRSECRLPIALGKSIGGDPVVADLATMPHLLVAGTTGSGKSVGINAIIMSLLYRLSPEDCRFIMIDPKMLELSCYNGIPHLLTPVVTDPQKAVTALNWVVREMEERYKRMSKLGVRNIQVFNNRVRNAQRAGESLRRTVQTGYNPDTGEAVYETEDVATKTMPYIVVVVDEMADLMMVAGKDIEAAVQRLAQMARAAGIHLIMATQRPSVDVITGTVKANFPTRISFKVTSKIDSRTILGEQGAEQLLGKGDMLFNNAGTRLSRIHGAFVSDEEVEQVVAYLRTQGEPDYEHDVTTAPPEEEAAQGHAAATGDDKEELYDKAVAIVLRDRKASTSYIQRRLSIGYNRAADLIDRMEAEGLIGPAGSGGKREILSEAQ